MSDTLYVNGAMALHIRAAEQVPPGGPPITAWGELPTATLTAPAPQWLLAWAEYLEYLDHLEKEHWLDNLN